MEEIPDAARLRQPDLDAAIAGLTTAIQSVEAQALDLWRRVMLEEAFWETVANAVAVVREANAEARAAGAPPGLTDEARAAGVTDEEWEAFLDAMDDDSYETRLFMGTRGGPPMDSHADLAAAALGGVAAYVALVVPLTL